MLRRTLFWSYKRCPCSRNSARTLGLWLKATHIICWWKKRHSLQIRWRRGAYRLRRRNWQVRLHRRFWCRFTRKWRLEEITNCRLHQRFSFTGYRSSTRKSTAGTVKDQTLLKKSSHLDERPQRKPLSKFKNSNTSVRLLPVFFRPRGLWKIIWSWKILSSPSTDFVG